MSPAPVRIGLLFDFPQPDGGEAFETAVHLGLDEVGGRLDRPVEFVRELCRGLPLGTEHDVRQAFLRLDEAGVLAIVGPSISDNSSIARDLTDQRRLAAVNYSGGAHTRGEWMFHYQVGSLEEEPAVLARHLRQRGLGSVAVVHDRSPVGAGYAAFFDLARATEGIEVTSRAAIAPLADDAVEVVERARRAGPDAVLYLGLGVAARTVAVSLDRAGWDVPVVANSALMFGYGRKDWRPAWEGWTYVDTVADDNAERQRLSSRSRPTASGPIGVAGYDIGRLLGEALARATHLTREGLRDALRLVKRLPAASGRDGTLMGFGPWDHAALKGEYLVLRRWEGGRTVQVPA